MNFIVRALTIATLLCSLLLSAVSAAEVQSVALDSVGKSYAFARHQIEQARARGEQIESVELIHVGAERPAELAALAEWFASEKITVNYRQVTPDEFNAALDEQAGATEGEAWEAARLIRYETGATDSEEAARLKFISKKDETLARVKHFFGVPKGISFMAYKIKRSVREKLVEGAVALAKNSITSFVLYYSLEQKIAEGHQLNMPLGVATATAFGLAFGYWQRGNSAYKGQGASFDAETGKMVMNRPMYLLLAFLDSLVMRDAIVVASHITDAGFTAGWSDFTSAFVTSAMGLLGKAPFEMYIERARRTHGKWWTIGVMTAWGLGYSSLQFLAQFEVHEIFGFNAGEAFRNTLMGMGVAGFGVELFRERARLRDGFDRFRQWMRGIDLRDSCQTLLLPRMKGQAKP